MQLKDENNTCFFSFIALACCHIPEVWVQRVGEGRKCRLPACMHVRNIQFYVLKCLPRVLNRLHSHMQTFCTYLYLALCPKGLSFCRASPGSLML